MLLLIQVYVWTVVAIELLFNMSNCHGSIMVYLIIMIQLFHKSMLFCPGILDSSNSVQLVLLQTSESSTFTLNVTGRNLVAGQIRMKMYTSDVINMGAAIQPNSQAYVYCKIIKISMNSIIYECHCKLTCKKLFMEFIGDVTDMDICNIYWWTMVF